MNGHYTIDNRDLTKNRNMNVRIQILKRPLSAMVQCGKPSQVIMSTEEQVVGFLDGNAGFV
jgi:exosome complex RNA-binding protein Rrp42 (RNase PH superfamily)